MTTSSTFAPNDGALASLLDAGVGPVIVLDPCGAQWDTFWNTSRWSRVWQAWRLAPGQILDDDSWDVLDALKSLNAAEGPTTLAAALFPTDEHSDLTRQLMACLLAFASDAGHICHLPALAGQLWADDPWVAISHWTRKHPYHPALQAARELLTHEGASESVAAIRNLMAAYHHPHIARTFTGGGLNLSSLRTRPAQIIFLTPDIRCMENGELSAVYAFLVTALRTLGSLHYVEFALVEPTLNTLET